MQNGYKGTPEEVAQSYAHWWHEAGFHTATDPDAHGWRQAPPVPFWQQRSDAPVTETVREIAPPPHHATETPAPPSARPADMPDSLPAFLDWMGRDESQPEAAWDGSLILPPAVAQAQLLVIVEMPASGAADRETLLDPVQLRFVHAVLASLGIKPDDALIAPLAARRPPGGLLDEETLARLTARMRHYLALARPRTTIMLGDRISRALVGSQRVPGGAPGGDGLQKINHGDGTIAAVSLPGLDLLMGRPAAKAKSWQALRLLQGYLNA